jgi:hypothetical protein
MPINNFVEDFMRGLQQGQQQKQAKQAELERAEDRKLEKMLLQHKLREITIAEKAQARGFDIDNFNRVDGKKSEKDYAITSAGFKPQAAPPMEFAGVQMPGQSFGLQAERDIPAMPIRGIEELGVGGVTQTPRTMEDVMRQNAEAELAKPFNLAPGAARFAGGLKVAENPAPIRPQAPISLEQQYVEALRKGDRDGAALILKTINDTKRAGQLPSTGGSGGGGSRSWVVRNGQPIRVTESEIQPGDVPYDPVAARQPAGMSDARAEALDTANEVKRIATALRSHPGLSGAFGVISSKLPTMRQSTADAEALLGSLQGLLTLENMGKMKGVLSDRDMEVLRKASTTLNASMSEAAAKAELLRLEHVMDKLVKAGGVMDIGAAQAGPRKVGGFIVEIEK